MISSNSNLTFVKSTNIKKKTRKRLGKNIRSIAIKLKRWKIVFRYAKRDIFGIRFQFDHFAAPGMRIRVACKYSSPTVHIVKSLEHARYILDGSTVRAYREVCMKQRNEP